MTDEMVATQQRRWTTPRLALVAVVGAINGALQTPIALAWTALTNAFGVLGAAAFQPFVILTSMVAWLLPLPGVYLLANTINGFANFLTGDPNGVAAVYWGISGGIAGEIALLLWGYSTRRRTAIVITGAALYIPATNVVTYFMFGWQPNTEFWVGVVISLVAIIVESALLGILLAKWVRRTGLLRTVRLDDDRHGDRRAAHA